MQRTQFPSRAFRPFFDNLKLRKKVRKSLLPGQKKFSLSTPKNSMFQSLLFVDADFDEQQNRPLLYYIFYLMRKNGMLSAIQVSR